MIFSTPESLAHLVAPWAHFYSHSKSAPTIVTFLHIAPIIVGGGLGIALDRSTLRVRAGDTDGRARHLRELGGAHSWVVGGLLLSVVTGLLLTAADLDTFLGSWAFWLKMGMLAVLLGNGFVMTRLETRLRAAQKDADVIWRRLRHAAYASLTLWLAITFVGVVLTNVA